MNHRAGKWVEEDGISNVGLIDAEIVVKKQLDFPLRGIEIFDRYPTEKHIQLGMNCVVKTQIEPQPAVRSDGVRSQRAVTVTKTSVPRIVEPGELTLSKHPYMVTMTAHMVVQADVRIVQIANVQIAIQIHK